MDLSHNHSGNHSEPSQQWITVGQFGAVHGLQGWLKLHSFTDPVDNILSYKAWSMLASPRPVPLIVEDSRRHYGALLVKLKGCDDPDTARPYVNQWIAIDSSLLPALPEGEYYWQDLVGFKVVNRQGQELGLVKNLLETGANDVLIVQGAKRYLIPFVRDHIIKRVHLSQGMIEVDWESTWV